MTAGRKPKPTATHKRQGTFRADRHTDGPDLPAGLGHPPAHLDNIAKREWRRVVPMLTEAGTLKQTHRAAMTGYCRSWSLYVEADKVVQKDGMMLLSAKTGQFYASPYLHAMTAAMKQMVAFAAELGMTPVSEARLKTGPVEERDPLFELLQNRGIN